VPALSGNAALEVLIGLFFLYFLLSLVCSSVNEAISSVLKLRAQNLEQGIRSLLDGEANAKAFYDHPRIQALIKPAGRFFKAPRKPSYISSRSFALTVLDTFAPPTGPRSNDLIARATKAVAAGGPASAHPTVQGMLRDALLEARGDVDAFRGAIERSFDEVMERASGWYKRKVQLILFLLAVGLVGVVNADTLGIAQRLWKDDALRATAVAQANRVVQAGGAKCAAKTPGATQGAATTQADVATATDCLDEVKALGLPFGWSHDTSPHSATGVLGKLLGLLVTAFALTLGAPFWFDLLGKVSHLRGSGAKPKS
jgi:hypothetical protein